MNNDNGKNDYSDWYTPLEQYSENSDSQRSTLDAQPSFLTPARLIGLSLLLLLVIVASSLAFAHRSEPGPDSGFSQFIPPAEPEEMPDDPDSFFRQYYQAPESDRAETEIEKTDARSDLVLTQTPSGETQLSLEELYERCAPSVVAISAYEGNKTGYSWGSGVILSGDGLILTNTHVIEDSDRATVTLWDDRELEAKLVGADAISDLAVLKIEAEGLAPATFGESGNLKVGDAVAAIGNPLGESFRNTLTDGIISAIERGMTYHGRSMTLLQTNTAINEGNSGGPLFNRYGQVVGITNMKMMSSYSSIEGIGFAIPSATVCEVVNAILRDGEVSGRPAIGITVGAIPDNAAEKYDLPDGLYVSAVSEGSDAKRQGIRPGDIITAVNGQAVTTTAEVNDIKNACKVGDELTFTIWRDGETLEITAAVVDMNDVY